MTSDVERDPSSTARLCEDRPCTLTPEPDAADLKDNLHDIQDNVVAPILMRYGRHVFVKFTDGARARAWLRNMFDRVNARQEEHGTRFTVNIGFTYEGLKALGLSQPSLDSFPEAFRVGMRGRARVVGDVGPHAPEHWEGGLGGPDIHAMALDSHRFRRRAAKRRCGSFAPRWRRPAGSRSGSSRTRWRSRTKTGSGPRASISVLPIRSRSRRSRARTRPCIPATACWSRTAPGVALKPGEFLLGYEDEAGPDGYAGARAARAAAERDLHGLPQALSGRGGVSPLPGDGREGALRLRRPASPGAGRGQDDGPLARAGARSICRPTRTIPRSRRIRSGATTSPMPATNRACAARSARTCVAAIRGRRRSSARPRCGGTG